MLLSSRLQPKATTQTKHYQGDGFNDQQLYTQIVSVHDMSGDLSQLINGKQHQDYWNTQGPKRAQTKRHAAQLQEYSGVASKGIKSNKFPTFI